MKNPLRYSREQTFRRLNHRPCVLLRPIIGNGYNQPRSQPRSAEVQKRGNVQAVVCNTPPSLPCGSPALEELILWYNLFLRKNEPSAFVVQICFR